MTQIKVLFWDLEDVCVKNIIEPALKLYGLTYGDKERKTWKECITGKINAREFFERALLGTELENKIDEVLRKATEIIQLKENGALPLIKSLQGKIRQGVISNQTSYFVDYINETFGIKKYFEPAIFIISGNKDIECDKSGEKIFEIALQRAGVKGNEALFFDDKQKYVDMAVKAGLNAELFTTGNEAERVMREKYNIVSSE
jgi:FMN phosphatase YigB (HAD superfamily)